MMIRNFFNLEDSGAFGSMVTIYNDLEIPQAST